MNFDKVTPSPTQISGESRIIKKKKAKSNQKVMKNLYSHNKIIFLPRACLLKSHYLLLVN